MALSVLRRALSTIAPVTRNKRSRTRRPPPFPDPYALPPSPDTFPKYQGRDFFRFEIEHESKRSGARAGYIHTPHGKFETPCYVAVATNAALKLADHRPLLNDLPLMFCNTYHLMLHPGADIVAEAGGLHEFMQRKGPIITDSGGFQVFSLAHGGVTDELNAKGGAERGKMLKGVSEEGAKFRSYRDGTEMTLTPESSVRAQKLLGADIIVPLDELIGYHVSRERLEKSVLLSHRWMARSLREHLKDLRNQAMYGVIHGGVDRELRELSASYVSSLPFDGFGVGGSLGKDRAELMELLEWVIKLLPRDRPRHLLGIGDEEGVRGGVAKGMDTFDSCFPTRLGRHGTVLSRKWGRVQIKSGKWKRVWDGIEDEEGAPSMGYLHHLWKANESVGSMMMTIQNIKYMAVMMRQIRNGILQDEV